MICCRQGIYRPILVLGYTDPAAAPILASNTITQTLFSEEYALQLAAEAAKAGCVVDCHVKIDTGMSRLGFDAENENTVLMVEKLAQSGSPAHHPAYSRILPWRMRTPP